jgi:hypothetical protein
MTHPAHTEPVRPLRKSPTVREDWRRELALKLACAFAAKLAALTLLWLLFFRGGAA